MISLNTPVGTKVWRIWPGQSAGDDGVELVTLTKITKTRVKYFFGTSPKSTGVGERRNCYLTEQEAWEELIRVAEKDAEEWAKIYEGYLRKMRKNLARCLCQSEKNL